MRIVILLPLPLLLSGFDQPTPRVSPPATETLQGKIFHASLFNDIDPSIALDLAYAESHENPAAVRRERNGSVSRGIFQLNDRTAAALGVRNALDPDEAIPVSVAYLANLVRAHGRSGAVCRWIHGAYSKNCK